MLCSSSFLSVLTVNLLHRRLPATSCATSQSTDWMLFAILNAMIACIVVIIRTTEKMRAFPLAVLRWPFVLVSHGAKCCIKHNIWRHFCWWLLLLTSSGSITHHNMSCIMHCDMGYRTLCSRRIWVPSWVVVNSIQVVFNTLKKAGTFGFLIWQVLPYQQHYSKVNYIAYSQSNMNLHNPIRFSSANYIFLLPLLHYPQRSAATRVQLPEKTSHSACEKWVMLSTTIAPGLTQALVVRWLATSTKTSKKWPTTTSTSAAVGAISWSLTMNCTPKDNVIDFILVMRHAACHSSGSWFFLSSVSCLLAEQLSALQMMEQYWLNCIRRMVLYDVSDEDGGHQRSEPFGAIVMSEQLVTFL